MMADSVKAEVQDNRRRPRDDDEEEEDEEDIGEGKDCVGEDQREQDRFLPIANIARIMKTQLPANAKIAKDAKESIQECVSEYISFITSEASDKCLQEKRKTINGDDILWAMSTLGFDKYIDPLKTYLHKYRDAVKMEKPEKKPTEAAMRREAKARATGDPYPGKVINNQLPAKRTLASSSSSSASKPPIGKMGTALPMKMGITMPQMVAATNVTPMNQSSYNPNMLAAASMPIYAPVAMTHPTSIGANYINPPLPPGMLSTAGGPLAIKREADADAPDQSTKRSKFD